MCCLCGVDVLAGLGGSLSRRSAVALHAGMHGMHAMHAHSHACMHACKHGGPTAPHAPAWPTNDLLKSIRDPT